MLETIEDVSGAVYEHGTAYLGRHVLRIKRINFTMWQYFHSITYGSTHMLGWLNNSYSYLFVIMPVRKVSDS